MKPGSQSISRIRTFTQDAENIETVQRDTPLDTAKKTAPQAAVKTELQKEIKHIEKQQEMVAIPMSAPEIPQPPRVYSNPSELKQVPKTTVAVLPNVPVMNSEIVLPEQETHSTMFIEENDLSGDSLESGTIIRETRRKRFRLLPATFKAATKWFSVQQTDYLARQPRIPTIEKSEVRASVIQKAAEESELAPREDFRAVTERLKKVERKPVRATLSFKPKEEVPEPVWSHTVLSEENAELPTAQTNQEIPLEENNVNEILDSEPILADIQEQPATILEEEKPEVSPHAITLEHIPRSSESKIVIPDAPATSMTAPEQWDTASKVSEQVAKTDVQSAHHTPARADAVIPPEKEPFPLPLLIGVIIATTLSGAAVAYIFFAHHSTNVQQTVSPKMDTVSVSSLLHTQSKTAVPLSSNRAIFLQSIQTALQQSQDVVQIYPTISEKEATAPASLDLTLQSLSWFIPDSFSRSIKEVDFGGVDGTDPYIIIRSSTFDIAFAGMLSWESYMSADLDPLFGSMVTRTFDPTVTDMPGVHFKDAIASNKNVRILFDEQGKDHIVYTFTDQNTILITTTRAALDKLLQRMQ